MSIKPEIPYLLDKMKERLELAKSKNKNTNFELQELTIDAFESLHRDYLYYLNECARLKTECSQLYKRSRDYAIGNQSLANKNLILSNENKQLKENIKL